MAKMQLKVVTPEEEIFNDLVDEVLVDTGEGQIGILPHHANLMAQIIPGELVIKNNDKENFLVTGSGLLQMVNNTLTIAIDSAQKAEDIDEKVAEDARKRAQEALEHRLGDEEYATTVANLEKALAQLKVRRKYRTRI